MSANMLHVHYAVLSGTWVSLFAGVEWSGVERTGVDWTGISPRAPCGWSCSHKYVEPFPGFLHSHVAPFLPFLPSQVPVCPPLVSIPSCSSSTTTTTGSSTLSPPPVPPSPFTLHVVSGNISICTGCRGQFLKDAPSPYNLCIQHMEWRQFTPHGYNTPQQKFCNA